MLERTALPIPETPVQYLLKIAMYLLAWHSKFLTDYLVQKIDDEDLKPKTASLARSLQDDQS